MLPDQDVGQVDDLDEFIAEQSKDPEFAEAYQRAEVGQVSPSLLLADVLFVMGGVTKEQAREHAAVVIEVLAERHVYLSYQPSDDEPIPSWNDDPVRKRLGLPEDGS